VSRIDVYFGATYQNGVFLKQAEIKNPAGMSI
jgi:hypothetical protein